MTLVGFAISIGMFAFGLYYGAPWYFLAPVALCTVLFIWQWIGNQVSGSEVTAQTVRLFVGQKETIVPVANIRAVRITQWSDGAPSVSLLLHEGPLVSVSTLCADGQFITVLNELGVPQEKA